MIDAADLAGLVEAAPDGLLMIGRDGVILFANHQAESLFGRGSGGLEGTSVDELLPAAKRSHHRELRERYGTDPRTRPMGSGIALEAVHANGSAFPVEVSLSPSFHDDQPVVIAAVRDVTQRRQAEAHTRRIERLIDRAHEGVYLLDPETLRLTYVNAGAVSHSGYSRDELLGRTPLSLLVDMDEAILRRLIARATDRGPIAPIITVLRHRDGDELPVELLLERDEAADGSPPAIAVLVRDLSERRDSEDELAEAQRDLEIVADRERIARDLHDRVIQRLFATSMSLMAAVEGDADPVMAGRVGRAVDDLDTTIREIRTVIFELQPPDGLESVRRRILATARAARAALGFEPSVQFTGPIEAVLTDQVAAEILPTLQEALSNVARHAGATTVEVAVIVSDALTLRVVDDGVGFRPSEAARPAGNGLTNMAARASRLGGRFHIDADSERPGTVLQWTVPIDAPSKTTRPTRQ